jgi:hypothetical protein
MVVTLPGSMTLDTGSGMHSTLILGVGSFWPDGATESPPFLPAGLGGRPT